MSEHLSPCEIVDRQLTAYNTRDIDAYCALFSAGAVLSKLNTGEELARGIEAIRAYYTIRFKNPLLNCKIKCRTALGDFVIDHEYVVGVGERPLEVIALYEVRQSLIQSVRLIWQ